MAREVTEIEISPYADDEARKKAEEVIKLEEKLKNTVKDHTVLGRPKRRLDAIEKVTGRAKYTGDISLPGMLYQRILKSSQPHAKIKSLDASKAEALAGVKAVVTYRDVPKNVYTWPPEYVGTGQGPGDEYILDDKVRYVGEPVAGVAAVTEEIAEEALELIEVEYEELEPVFDIEDAMEPDAPLVHDGGNQATVAGPMPTDKPGPGYTVEWGDIEKGFTEADFIIKDTITYPRPQQAVPVEERTCVAKWDGDKVTVWINTQAAGNIQVFLASWLGLPYNKVRVITPYVGGGFGSKSQVQQEDAITLLLSKKAGKPVKRTSGIFDYSTSRTVTDARAYVKAGFKNDGTITAIYLRYLLGAGAYAEVTPLELFTALNMTTELFRIQNCKFEGYAIYTNNIPTTSYRGFGMTYSFWAVWQVVNKAIERLGIDLLDYNLKHAVIPGDRVWVFRLPLVHAKVRECLRVVAQKAGWRKKWHKPGEKTLPNGKKHGIGLAWRSYTSGAAWQRPAAVVIEMNSDATFKLVTGASEIGSGQKTMAASVAAEVLKVEPDDFEVLMSDTDMTLYDTQQTGNRTTQCVGNATALAAEDVKRQLLGVASTVLEVSPNELDMKDKRVFVKGRPENRVTYEELLKHVPFTIVGTGIYTMPLDIYWTSPLAVVVEVEVDPETGEVAVGRVTMASDTGVVINSGSCESQALGAMYGGIGHTLREEMTIDCQTRIPLNPMPNPWYALPTIKEVEKVEPVTFIESYCPLGPFGAKGGGSEGAFYAIPHAINAAIHNAIGIWVRESPITPRRILEALGKVRGVE